MFTFKSFTAFIMITVILFLTFILKVKDREYEVSNKIESLFLVYISINKNKFPNSDERKLLTEKTMIKKNLIVASLNDASFIKCNVNFISDNTETDYRRDEMLVHCGPDFWWFKDNFKPMRDFSHNKNSPI